jgi:hypothetical protein
LSVGDASCLARSLPLHRTVYDIDRNSPRRFSPTLWRLRSRASRSSVMNGHRPFTVRSVPYRADVSFVEYFRFRNKSRSLPTSGALRGNLIIDEALPPWSSPHGSSCGSPSSAVTPDGARLAPSDVIPKLCTTSSLSPRSPNPYDQ